MPDRQLYRSVSSSGACTGITVVRRTSSLLLVLVLFTSSSASLFFVVSRIQQCVPPILVQIIYVVTYDGVQSILKCVPAPLHIVPDNLVLVLALVL